MRNLDDEKVTLEGLKIFIMSWHWVSETKIIVKKVNWSIFYDWKIILLKNVFVSEILHAKNIYWRLSNIANFLNLLLTFSILFKCLKGHYCNILYFIARTKFNLKPHISLMISGKIALKLSFSFKLHPHFIIFFLFYISKLPFFKWLAQNIFLKCRIECWRIIIDNLLQWRTELRCWKFYEAWL